MKRDLYPDGCKVTNIDQHSIKPQLPSVAEFEIHVTKCQLSKFDFAYYMHGLVEETGEVFEGIQPCLVLGHHRRDL